MSDSRNSDSWPTPAQEPPVGNYPVGAPQPAAQMPAPGGAYPPPGAGQLPPGQIPPGSGHVPPGHDGQTPRPAPKSKGFGIAALVIGIISLIGAFIPVVNYISGVLAFIGLALGIIGLCLRSHAKGMALTGSILSGIALVLSIVLAITYTSSFVNAIIDYAPSPTSTSGPDAADDPGGPGNPFPIGTSAQLGDADPEWEIMIDDVLIDDAGEDEYTTTSFETDTETDAGTRYIAVEVTVTYIGDTSGLPASDLSISFVDATGAEHESGYGGPAPPSTPFTQLGTLDPDETANGSVVIEVPEDTMQGGLVRVAFGSADECYFGGA